MLTEDSARGEGMRLGPEGDGGRESEGHTFLIRRVIIEFSQKQFEGD